MFEKLKNLFKAKRTAKKLLPASKPKFFDPITGLRRKAPMRRYKHTRGY
jgi:hypothetical protein